MRTDGRLETFQERDQSCSDDGQEVQVRLPLPSRVCDPFQAN